MAGTTPNTPTAAAVVAIERSFPDSPHGAEITKRNARAVRAVIAGMKSIRKQAIDPQPVDTTPTGQSKAADVDPVTRLTGAGRLIAPPFDPRSLAAMPENSTELGPAIEALVVNIECFGYHMEPRIPVDEDTSEEILTQLVEEKIRIENFFASAFEVEDSLEEFRTKVRRDFEAIGYAAIEHVMSVDGKTLEGLRHLPSHTIRLGRQDNDVTEYDDLVVERQVQPGEDNKPVVNFVIKKVRRHRRFRRYAQHIGGKNVVWFKELGDPRLISCRDGNPVTEADLKKEHDTEIPRWIVGPEEGKAVLVPKSKIGFDAAWTANPMKHLANYSTRSPYGLPRYIGQMFAIFGSRAAEEINFSTFKNNNIPSMVVTVTNGQLDEASINRMEEFVESTIASDDNYSKFLILEAEPSSEGVRDPGSTRIEVKPLTKEQHTDALFTVYTKENDAKVRRAYRLPPVFVGLADSLSGDVIDASRRMADEQIFAPERKRIDDYLTRHVLLPLGVARSIFRSNSPNVTENGDLIRLAQMLEKTGGMTPRIARRILNVVTGRDYGEVDTENLDPDKPFSLTLAELMKQTSPTGAAGGGEPTSQGRTGLQVGTSAPRDRGSEPAAEDLGKVEGETVVDRLHKMLGNEVQWRYGGLLTAWDEDPEEFARRRGRRDTSK